MQTQKPGLTLTGRGILMTDQYNTTVDWNQEGNLFINDKGFFDLHPAPLDPVAARHMKVQSIPSPENPYLGIEFDFNH